MMWLVSSWSIGDTVDRRYTPRQTLRVCPSEKVLHPDIAAGILQDVSLGPTMRRHSMSLIAKINVKIINRDDTLHGTEHLWLGPSSRLYCYLHGSV